MSNSNSKMSIREVAEKCGVNPMTIYRHIKKGTIEATQNPFSREWEIDYDKLSLSPFKFKSRKGRPSTFSNTYLDASRIPKTEDSVYVVIKEYEMRPTDTYRNTLNFIDEFFLLDGDITPQRLREEGITIKLKHTPTQTQTQKEDTL